MRREVVGGAVLEQTTVADVAHLVELLATHFDLAMDGVEGLGKYLR